MKKRIVLICVGLALVMIPQFALGKMISKSKGQLIYAPAVHNCFVYQATGNPCALRASTRLLVRNIDMENAIQVISINLYDPDGVLAYEFLTGPTEIAPLASKTFSIPYDAVPLWDANSDARPSFIVKWQTHKFVFPPMIESGRATINDFDGEGLSWGGLSMTPGTVLKELYRYNRRTWD